MKNDLVFEFNGYSLASQFLDSVPLDGRYVINTVSPNSYGISVHDKKMDDALRGSDVLILDGVYFGWLPRLKYGKKIKRITGWDSFQFFSKKMQSKRGRVFFLGSSEDTLEKITEKYKITMTDLIDYNELENITSGSKLIIPNVKHD